MNKETELQKFLKTRDDDRMFRVFHNLQVRTERRQNEDGTETQEMIVEGQAVTFEQETVLFEYGETEYRLSSKNIAGIKIFHFKSIPMAADRSL